MVREEITQAKDLPLPFAGSNLEIHLDGHASPLTKQDVRELMLRADLMYKEMDARKELNGMYGESTPIPSALPTKANSYLQIVAYRDKLLNDPNSKKKS